MEDKCAGLQKFVHFTTVDIYICYLVKRDTNLVGMLGAEVRVVSVVTVVVAQLSQRTWIQAKSQE